MFSKSFLDESIEILERLSIEDIEGVVGLLRATRDRGGRVFLCGSGGGAGHASHATCDFRKLCGLECYCISDNVSELTARINDEGWDTAYSAWLERSRLSATDTLFVFSVGGGDIERNISVNLVNAMRAAKDVGSSITGIVGRDGGVLAKWADVCVKIPMTNRDTVTPQTEGIQALVWHLIVSHPQLVAAQAKWESTR
jgi:D-sedoheptulose 7-phosphate isomerase